MTYKTKAIVLRSRPFPRGARLYTLYSQRFGKIKGVAAGSQKIKSKVAGHLQPFTIVEVMMAKGRTLDRLAQGRYLKGFNSFSQDFTIFLQGSYVLEVIDSLTDEGVADYLIWQLIEELFSELDEQSLWAVNGLGQMSNKADLLIRLFAFKLLDRFGFRPELYYCLHCRTEPNYLQEKLYFSLASSGIVCSSCVQNGNLGQEVSAEYIKFLRLALKVSLSKAHRIVLPIELESQITEHIDQMVVLQIQRPLHTMKYLRPQKEYISTY